MQIEQTVIEALQDLQAIDMNIVRTKKQLEALPQRGEILAVRKKLASVREKALKVDEMFANSSAKLEEIEAEDAKLSKKQDDIQAEINSVKGDFRSVESRTKELEGVNKRREHLAQEHDKVFAEYSQIKSVKDQIESTIVQLSEQEAGLIASFRKDGGALQATIAQLEVSRKAIVADVPRDVMEKYEDIAKLCGGIALATLDGARCSVCRCIIDEAHLLQVKRNAPLASCPGCRRLLLVLP